jgi:hypothetical protein
MFFELANPDDYSSKISMVAPVSREGILQGTRIKQVAPDRFLHPVHILRRYLDRIGRITASPYAVGRIRTVNSLRANYPPVPPPVARPDPTFVQPPQGAGPDYSFRSGWY